ncbi:MAG: TfoX/Sxy family protein [Salaquimonas sp.]
MAVTKEFLDYLADLFSVVPHSNIKKMFGGAGIFRHGLMYALALGDGKIALKADAQTIPDFEAEGCEAWYYEDKRGGKKSMNYWYMPERLADDPDELLEWSMKAFEVAMRADQAKSPSQRKMKG